MTDQPRDEDGRFASGNSMGRQPVTSSGDQPSVHTRLRAAARDAVIRGKMVDQSHRPIRTDHAIAAITDHGKAGASPGRFKYKGGVVR
ncbi:MAG: hypothetical protein ACRECV_02090 [Xanthobacteraceae bacterium]